MRRILSLQNPLVKHLVKLRKDRRYRTSKGRVVLTGDKLIKEVCKDKVAYSLLLLEGKKPHPQIRYEQAYFVKEEVLKKVSGLESAVEAVAEVEAPKEKDLKSKMKLLVLDGVSDPGNLGTLLRTALAFSWEGVFILHSSVDPLNDKALRAAKGATFRLDYRLGTWEEAKDLCLNSCLHPLLGCIKGEAPENYVGEEGIFLVLGNESKGPSQEAMDFCKKISIPMSSQMESLNVATAGGILMYLLGSK